MEFTDSQVQRYSRHIILSEVGGKGQKKLSQAKVLIIGAGGLGSPAGLYLAAAGVGTIGLSMAMWWTSRICNARFFIRRPLSASPKWNPDGKLLPPSIRMSRVKTYQHHVSADNIMGLLPDYDIILDGSDNFSTRFMVNDACYFAKKTLISGSIFRFEGQLTTIKPHQGYPCYRCLYPEPPPAGLVPNCQEAGVLGVLAGTIGVLQASEAIKEILGIGETMADRLLIYDALEMKFRRVSRPKDPDCPLCGINPRLRILAPITT